jgi:hypothetical protein
MQWPERKRTVGRRNTAKQHTDSVRNADDAVVSVEKQRDSGSEVNQFTESRCGEGTVYRTAGEVELETERREGEGARTCAECGEEGGGRWEAKRAEGVSIRQSYSERGDQNSNREEERGIMGQFVNGDGSDRELRRTKQRAREMSKQSEVRNMETGIQTRSTARSCKQNL